MTPSSFKGMVLAAGLGTRMRPLTNDRSKAMVEVAGRPLVDWAIDRYAQAGVEEVIVNVHHFADPLEAHVRRRSDVKITLSDERDTLLETGGGISRVLPLMEGQPFYVQNCDTMWVDGVVDAITRLADAWDGDLMDGLLLLAPTVLTTGYDGSGDFDMDRQGRLSRRPDRGVAPFVFTGAQILHPRLFDAAPKPPFSTNVLFDRAIQAGRLFGLRHDSYWMHVGTPEAINEAERALQ
ncbi:MAG: nucleotidyltransferase family protein, partial [Pseudomonadota bacterium]